MHNPSEKVAFDSVSDTDFAAEVAHSIVLAELERRVSTLMSAKPRPFIRWVGSKRQLLPQILPYLPGEYTRYVAPFLGGGSLFFLLRPRTAVLADKCEPLMKAYGAIASDVEPVLQALGRMPVSEEHYYRFRNARPRLPHTQAARFIYLNKTCFNGLYRVNSRGEFNVPFGRPKSLSVVDPSNLRAVAALLNGPGIQIRTADFRQTLSYVAPGDLVFIDPPYATTAPRRTTFLEYNETIFSWADQRELASRAHDLRARGAHVLVTNANDREISNLYRGFHKVELFRSSTFAASSSARGLSVESLFVGKA